MYNVYLLRSLKNGKAYVGFTQKDPEIRLAEHNSGSSSWTKHNGPFDLKYYESFMCKEDALRREKFLKSGVGKKLKEIILEHF